MNEASLGAKLEPSPTNQAVVPFAGTPAASTQRKDVPPHVLTSMPRCVLYQARSLAGSLALMKTPPIPVTRFIATFPVLSSDPVVRFVDFWESLFSGCFSGLFAPEADSVLFPGAFAPEALSRSWAWMLQMGRTATVNAVHIAFVLVCMMRGDMVMGILGGWQR